MEIVKTATATDKDLEKINAFTRRELTKDEVYIFTVALCDNDIDRDFEKFTIDALKQMQPMFIGKTGILDHSMRSEDQNSRIFDTWIEKVDGIKTRDGEELHQLKAKAYILRSDKTKTLIDEIDAGIKKEVSVSCSMAKSACSICGADRKDEPCGHMPGQVYDGELCFYTLEGPQDVYEFSFVAVPAQRAAGVTKSFDLEKGRECRSVTPIFDSFGMLEGCVHDKDGVRVIESFAEDALENADLSDVVLKDENGKVTARTKDGSLRITQKGSSLYYATTAVFNGPGYLSYKSKDKIEFERMDGGTAVYRRTIEAVEKVYSLSIGEGIAEKSIESLVDGVIKQAQTERTERLNRKKLEMKKKLAKSKLGG